jgi:arylformamidase
MARFPGDAAYEECRTFAMGPGCPVNVARIAMSTHCGSHADAPLHYDAAGAAIGALALEPFIGPCRVIDARAAGPLCLPEHIAAFLDDVPPRVLLRLAERSDPHVWPTASGISAEVIGFLASKGVRLGHRHAVGRSGGLEGFAGPYAAAMRAACDPGKSRARPGVGPATTN